MAAAVEAETDEETLPPSPMTMQDGIRAVQTAFGGPTPPRWPMYVRQAKQYLRNAIEGFDEKNYGFASVVDLLRAAGKEGVLRIERDRQGAVRVFAGPKLAAAPAPPVDVEPVAEPAVVNAEPVVGSCRRAADRRGGCRRDPGESHAAAQSRKAQARSGHTKAEAHCQGAKDGTHQGRSRRPQ